MNHIREYGDRDYDYLQKAMVALQEYIIALDPWRRGYIDDTFAERYTNDVLKKVKDGNGKIYIADCDGKGVGIIAGVIVEPSEKPAPDEYFHRWREGKIIELYVDEGHRGSGAAYDLMKAVEDFFKSQDCVSCSIEVFGYNEPAKKFYSKCGFETRMLTVAKKL